MRSARRTFLPDANFLERVGEFEAFRPDALQGELREADMEFYTALPVMTTPIT